MLVVLRPICRVNRDLETLEDVPQVTARSLECHVWPTFLRNALRLEVTTIPTEYIDQFVIVDSLTETGVF